MHFHTLVAQGVFAERADGTRRFAPAPAPTEREVARLLAAVRRRIIRLVARHGINLADPREEVDADDERRSECPAYAEIQGAAVLGLVATGPRAGARVMRGGGDPSAPTVPAGAGLHAQSAGFDLHAAVAVPAGDRKRLEHLCRYVLRPPLAQQAIELAPDGSILLHLRRAWRDGTRAIRFAPTELIEKLAAMIPKPRINLLVYHGAFAPHARGRREAVRRDQEESAPDAIGDSDGDAARRDAGSQAAADGIGPEVPAVSAVQAPPSASGRGPARGGYLRRRHFPWADLLRRTFAIDVLVCPGCGGRLRLLATIAHPPTIAKILRHLGLPVDVPVPAPARQPSWWPAGASLAVDRAG